MVSILDPAKASKSTLKTSNHQSRENSAKALLTHPEAHLDPAPLAVFAFNRPAHLRRTLLSLIACDGFEERPVFLFIDGPRNQFEEGQVKQVQETVRELLGPDIITVSQERNIGLAASISFGIDRVLAEYDSIIVVEDDLELSPIFLRFMDAALNKYRDRLDIYQISGHIFDVPDLWDRNSVIILPFITTWGWGTWKRAWAAYDPEARGWKELFLDQELRKQFDLGGCYPYAQMLKRQQIGLSNSWGIRWYWSVFKRNGKCIFPTSSLVRNTGQDGSGTHGGGYVWTSFAGKNHPFSETVPTMPEELTESEKDLSAVKNAIWRQNGRWLGWAKGKLQGWLGR